MTYKYKHTIVTMFYNRVNLMYDVYDSLLALDYDPKGFEWLIIDDGSTEDLKSLVDQLTDAPFEIRYVRKENGGIHTALNRAVLEANGEFITRIDSDDIIHPQALKRMDNWIEYLKKDTGSFPEDVIGVVGLCEGKNSGVLKSSKLPEDVMLTTGIELRKIGAYGDRNFCMRTEVMRKFPIPELPGTKWVPEGIMWTRVDRKYKTLYVNEVFAFGAEPNPNSLTGTFNDSLVKRNTSNCMSRYYGALYAINEASDTLSIKKYFRAFVSLWVNILMCKEKKAPKVIGEINGKHKFACILTYLPCRIYVTFKRMTSK